MNTKQLQYVLVLAQEGSFSKAADVLNITQPSLSQYIKKIEKEIGLELFDRTNGYVRITDAGKIYIDAGRKILELEHRMENAFIDIAANKTGSLVVGTSPYRAASMLPAVAAAFRLRHPGMHLIVREGTTAELVEGMEHGEYALVLTLLPIDGRLFAWEKVAEEELLLAVPRAFPDFPAKSVGSRRFPAIEPEELCGKGLVMLTDAQYMQRQLNNLLFDYKLKVETAAVVNSLEAQIEFVKAGVGMALLPSGVERFCKPGEITFYSFVPELPRREVVLAWRKDRKLSKTAEEFKNTILAVPW